MWRVRCLLADEGVCQQALVTPRLKFHVIPAKAGIQSSRACLDTGLRRYDSDLYYAYLLK